MKSTDKRGPGWLRSSTCSNGPDTCVEVAFQDDLVRVRNSQQPAGPILTFTTQEWRAFLDGAQSHEFDVPSD